MCQLFCFSVVNQLAAPVSQSYLFWFNTLHVSDGLSFCPSSGVQDCTYSNRYKSNRYCELHATKQVAVSVWHIPVAVCTGLNSCWWTERPSETCRVLNQNKWLWETGASGWYIIEIYYDARTYERRNYFVLDVVTMEMLILEVERGSYYQCRLDIEKGEGV
jgi:hypothetical protein